MKNTLALISNIVYLKLPPEAWDAIYPEGPDLTPAMRQFMAATVVRDIAKRVSDHNLSTSLHAVGKQLLGVATRELADGYDDVPDTCPPWPYPHHGPWQVDGGLTSSPQPQPWISAAMEQVVLGNLVAGVAAVVTHNEVSMELHRVSRAIIKAAATKLVAENN